jgi:hypothetical protein
LLAGPALAQSRFPSIPADAHRGVIRHLKEMAVAIDGKPMQLAAGAQIRNRQNLIIVPIAIPREGAWADYLLNARGEVFRVWLLTSGELASEPGAGG